MFGEFLTYYFINKKEVMRIYIIVPTAYQRPQLYDSAQCGPSPTYLQQNLTLSPMKANEQKFLIMALITLAYCLR